MRATLCDSFDCTAPRPGLMLCVWPHCTTFVSIAGFAAAAGFFNGGCITCYPALAAEIFPPQQLGRAISLIYTYGPGPHPPGTCLAAGLHLV